ncbi:MAG: hypothetical protein HOG34_18095 [Bacteroidetes bacterium]|nr:hypothetical protein [Bacteroidota bacterium]
MLSVFSCSEAELVNPNHTGTPNYIKNASNQQNELLLSKLGEGVGLEIVGSDSSITNWLVRSYFKVGDSLAVIKREISVSKNEDGRFIGIDTGAVWGGLETYVSYGNNDAGLSRSIDTTEIVYDFGSPLVAFSSVTSSLASEIRMYIIPDESDRVMLDSIDIAFTESSIRDSLVSQVSDDTLRLILSKFQWQTDFSYDLIFNSGSKKTVVAKESCEILPPEFEMSFRFLGIGGVNCSMKTTSDSSFYTESPIAIPREVHVHSDLIDIYKLNVDGEPSRTFTYSDDTYSLDSVSTDLLEGIAYDNLVGKVDLVGHRDTLHFKYEDILSDTEIPTELEKMSFIPEIDGEGAFYMDIYEMTYDRMHSSYQPDISNSNILADYNNFLNDDAFDPSLIPAIGVSQSSLSDFLADNFRRELPTHTQWKIAGTGSSTGTGAPIYGASLILPQNCNYANSGDSFEGAEGYPTLQLVPVDFFSGVESSLYTVDQNPPDIAVSPRGIYQMAGNMLEWIQKDDQYALIGGSFWSSPDDTSFMVESVPFVPGDGDFTRDSYGFRTVINDTDPPDERYYINKTLINE